MSTIVYLNDAFIPKEKACISPDDRGFYFADGIYEVIKYYNGKAFCLSDHMERLRRSLSSIRINFTGIDQIESLANELIHLNHMEEGYTGVYMQITRGVNRRMHQFPDESACPTFYMNAYPLPPFINELKKGIRVILREDIRWQRCDIKSIMLLPNVLMYQEAIENGARECFFVRDGYFTESTHSNIFGVKNGEVYTHPDSNHILPGITKRIIVKICNKAGITVKETPVRVKDCKYFDEFFISGTGSEIMPVIQLGDIPVRNGKPGTITRQIQQEFFRITYGEIAGDENYSKWIAD
ncbi:MAG: D-amino-acid transaminase [Bacteroidales bacterium]|nr:D-amino-acid transaminase [Bacteroidales bacterium]